MKHRKAEARFTGVEVLAVAGLVAALAVMGVVGVGFELRDFFAAVGGGFR
jgi:hypothetical protein